MKLHLGSVVEIHFWDHSSSDGHSAGPIICVVYGKIVKVDKLHFRVCTWDLPTCEDGSRETNQELFSILRSTIIKMTVFGRGRSVKNFK